MLNQDQLDNLYSTCLDMAVDLLQKHGEFFPFACQLTRSGEIALVGVTGDDEQPPSQQVIDDLRVVLSAGAKSQAIASCAMAVDIRIRPDAHAEPRDAIQVRVRAPDYARDVNVLYDLHTSGIFKKTRRVDLDAPRASAAENDIFR